MTRDDLRTIRDNAAAYRAAASAGADPLPLIREAINTADHPTRTDHEIVAMVRAAMNGASAGADPTPIRRLESALKVRATTDGEVVSLMNLLGDALHEARHQACACSAGADPEPRPKCDAVLAYCGLPMHHAEPHEFARAELRAQGGPSLDVRRLAEAMHNEQAARDNGCGSPGESYDDHMGWHLYRAERIEAEYARLGVAPESDTPGEEGSVFDE